MKWQAKLERWNKSTVPKSVETLRDLIQRTLLRTPFGCKSLNELKELLRGSFPLIPMPEKLTPFSRRLKDMGTQGSTPKSLEANRLDVLHPFRWSAAKGGMISVRTHAHRERHRVPNSMLRQPSWTPLRRAASASAPPRARCRSLLFRYSPLRRDQMRTKSWFSVATGEAKIGAEKLGSSSSTERYSRPAFEVHCQAAPNSRRRPGRGN
jgi:hypothetical protein